MGFFSESAIDHTGSAAPATETTASAVALAQQRDDARQQAEEDVAKAVLSQLTDGGDAEEADDTPTPEKVKSAKEIAAEKIAEDAEKRAAHEAAEAKRKAEWEEKKRLREEAEQAAWENAVAMDDDAVMAASMKRVGDDSEKLTRRNMKQCVTEYIQTKCLDDVTFARQVMHPRKNMIKCFRYINRKAREFIEQEMKDNDEKPMNGVYGSDVPDDLCYQWAVDYFMDLDAVEDKENEEKFVPKPYTGGGNSKGKKKPDKKPEPKTPAPADKKVEPIAEQVSLGEQMYILDVVAEVPA